MKSFKPIWVSTNKVLTATCSRLVLIVNVPDIYFYSHLFCSLKTATSRRCLITRVLWFHLKGKSTTSAFGTLLDKKNTTDFVRFRTRARTASWCAFLWSTRLPLTTAVSSGKPSWHTIARMLKLYLSEQRRFALFYYTINFSTILFITGCMHYQNSFSLNLHHYSLFNCK